MLEALRVEPLSHIFDDFLMQLTFFTFWKSRFPVLDMKFNLSKSVQNKLLGAVCWALQDKGKIYVIVAHCAEKEWRRVSVPDLRRLGKLGRQCNLTKEKTTSDFECRLLRLLFAPLINS